MDQGRSRAIKELRTAEDYQQLQDRPGSEPDICGRGVGPPRRKRDQEKSLHCPRESYQENNNERDNSLGGDDGDRGEEGKGGIALQGSLVDMAPTSEQGHSSHCLVPSAEQSI